MEDMRNLSYTCVKWQLYGEISSHKVAYHYISGLRYFNSKVCVVRVGIFALFLGHLISL
jgi:hypothetical protein